MVDRDYWKRRNADRRRQYAANPEYREECIRQSRRYYRAKTGIVRRNVARDGVKKLGYAKSVSLDDFAKAIGRSPKVVRGWVEAGMLPAPTGEGDSYTRQQAVALARVLASHFDEVTLLRRDHAQTIERLKAAYTQA